MKKSKFIRLAALVMCAVMASAVMSACKPTENRKYDSEKDPLSIATQTMDGVFSPFFATSGYDTEVVGMTNISMFATDKKGRMAYGKDYPVVTLDYAEKIAAGNTETEYQFVLKNNIKFSDGTPLTIKDVLFNMYVYLDPFYTGSSTMYSTHIKGLSLYRTQNSNQEETDFEATFVGEAEDRVVSMVEVNNEIWEEMESTGDRLYHEDFFKPKEGDSEQVKQGKEDILLTYEKFKEELGKDYEGYKGSYVDKGVKYEYLAFLIEEGIIKQKVDEVTNDPIYDANNKPVYDLGNWESREELNKEQAVDLVYRANIVDTNNFATIANYWATANEIRTKFIAEAKDAYFKGEGAIRYKTVEGINVLKGSQFMGANTYTDDYYVLSVTINGIDPKAKWNFGFTVAPVNYYSDASVSDLFDENDDWHSFNVPDVDGYDENKPISFGFKSHDNDYNEKVLQAKNKLPMGAGAYKAHSYDGGEVTANSFLYLNNVYFVRNDYFYTTLGDGTDTSNNAKIKYVTYKTIDAAHLYESIKTKEVAYADPAANIQTMTDLIKEKEKGKLDYYQVDNLGYGYIGINAGKAGLEDVHVRRALMYAMDTSLILNYYPNGLAEVIHRPMSKVSWAYPDGATAVYPFDASLAKTKAELEAAGYVADSSGAYKKNGKALTLKFTVAGDTSDHPAYATLNKAMAILNSLGCNISLISDSQALSRLTNGSLEVWAAAWSSAIDPDMYQVYHKDSNATSVLNWGYREIKKDKNNVKFSETYSMIERLSALIDRGRELLDEASRTPIYGEALNLIMDMAVELPLYQRKDLFVFDCNIIDKNTLVPETAPDDKPSVSPYYSPMAEMWKVDYVK